MSDPFTLTRVTAIVGRHTMPQVAVHPAARLCEDLTLDSLSRVSIACDCDEAFQIALPDDAVAEWQTLADVARAVDALRATSSEEKEAHHGQAQEIA